VAAAALDPPEPPGRRRGGERFVWTGACKHRYEKHMYGRLIMYSGGISTTVRLTER
jgi:hypothetical protein